MEGRLFGGSGVLFLTKVDVDGVSAGPAITDTNLHHVAVTKSGTSVVFYVDGAAYPVAAPYTDTFQFTTPAAIGVRGDHLNGDNNDSFFGTIDEVSIYNRALSSNEVAAIYAAGSAGKCLTSCTATIATAALPSVGGTTSGGGSKSCGQGVTVTATPNSGYLFLNWTEDGTNVSYSSSYSFVASADRALVANFTLMPEGFLTWQMQYFGCTDCVQAAAIADPDGDGQSNLTEFFAGTNPTNSASAFRIVEIVPMDEDILLTWTTVGGKKYAVQTATPTNGSYTTNDFVELEPVIIAPGVGESMLSVIDIGSATNKPSRFYRIRLVP